MSQTHPDPLIRVAQFIGDFGNPFYDEERQRDVWNEACAFGLQLLLWSTLGGSRSSSGSWASPLSPTPRVLWSWSVRCAC